MILVVTQTFAPAKGGMEAYLTGLAEHLCAAGWETQVLADHPAPDYKPQAPYALRRFGGWRPWRRWQKRRAIRDLLATGRVEGIFCDSWKSIESLPANCPSPIAVLAHGAEFPPEPSPGKKRRIARALSIATSIIANSAFTVQVARPFLSDPADPRLIVIHPPIDPLPQPEASVRDALATTIAGRSPVLSVLARLEPRKGVDRVIAALPALRQRHPNLVFLIGGGGADSDRLAQLAHDQGVADHVEFLGMIDAEQKTALMSLSDVFAMPVRRVGTSVEGFGISYIEAAWYGVPSVGGSGSGAADAVHDGETGLLVDGEDQTAVTAALSRLLDDEAFRRRLGDAAQRRVQNELTWVQAMPRFLATLRLAPNQERAA